MEKACQVFFGKNFKLKARGRTQYAANQGYLYGKAVANVETFLRKKLAKALSLCYNMEDIYPWHSWIARQTPTLQVEGSNPFG